MKKQYTDFVKYLLQYGFIEKFHTGFAEQYRLATERRIHTSAEHIAFLKKEYEAGYEKGGVFLTEPHYENGHYTFITRKIEFIKNVAEFPDWQYLADPEKLKEVRDYAFKNRLLPFDFHSHPTKKENIVSESFAFYKEMLTSGADHLSSFFPLYIDDLQLRLPDILVVGNGSMKSGIFVGYYGGLVAPLDFEESKQQVAHEWMKRNCERAKNYFSTPERQFWGVIGVLVAIIIFARWPKAIIPTAIGTAAILPSFVYASAEENEFYGISHGLSLDIVLPKINDEIILRDEKLLVKLYKEWQEKQKQKK